MRCRPFLARPENFAVAMVSLVQRPEALENSVAATVDPRELEVPESFAVAMRWPELVVRLNFAVATELLEGRGNSVPATAPRVWGVPQCSLPGTEQSVVR